MSTIVATMKKLKIGNLKGLQYHEQRETKNHKNEDIDIEKSHQNYDLINGDKKINYKTNIVGFINSKKSSKRKIRKDATLVDEWIIGSDKDFFETLSPDREKEFFEKSVDYFQEKFGDEHVRYAIVHKDESTPHMHMGVVPLTNPAKDGKVRLSSKELFDRTALLKIQRELPEYLQEQGFDINRGELGSSRKSLTVPEYKKAMDEKKESEKETNEIKDELADLIAFANPHHKVKKEQLKDLEDTPEPIKEDKGRQQHLNLSLADLFDITKNMLFKKREDIEQLKAACASFLEKFAFPTKGQLPDDKKKKKSNLIKRFVESPFSDDKSTNLQSVVNGMGIVFKNLEKKAQKNDDRAKELDKREEALKAKEEAFEANENNTNNVFINTFNRFKSVVDSFKNQDYRTSTDTLREIENDLFFKNGTHDSKVFTDLAILEDERLSQTSLLKEHQEPEDDYGHEL